MKLRVYICVHPWATSMKTGSEGDVFVSTLPIWPGMPGDRVYRLEAEIPDPSAIPVKTRMRRVHQTKSAGRAAARQGG